MSRTGWIALLLLCLSASSVAAERGVVVIRDQGGEEVGLYAQSHALLIGVSDYAAGWPDLESVPGELERVERVLRAQGFTTKTVLNPNAQQLEGAFEDFIGRYGFDSDNRLLFYFAGHGHTRKHTKGYLVPADAPDPRRDKKGFLRKALSMSQIIAWTRQIEAKHALFLFDSCFSGTVFLARDLPEQPPHITTLTNAPVRQFITAGSAGETVPAKSTFAQVFADGIEHRLADLDKDGFVTGTELGYHIQATVPKHVPQTPQFGKHPDHELSRGDFVFRVGAGDTTRAGPKSRGDVGVNETGKWLKLRRTTTVRATVQAVADVNPDATGRPSSLVVRFYELTDTSRFSNASFFELYHADFETLGASMQGRDEMMLRPGQSLEFERVIAGGTRFIGVIGAYIDLGNAEWRSVIEVEENAVNYLGVSIGHNSIDMHLVETGAAGSTRTKRRPRTVPSK